jgi:hypothetical protein
VTDASVESGLLVGVCGGNGSRSSGDSAFMRSV